MAPSPSPDPSPPPPAWRRWAPTVLVAAGLAATSPMWLAAARSILRSAIATARVSWVFRPVEHTHGEPMDVALAPDGSVWVTTKYGLTRFADGDPQHGELVMDSPTFRATFGHAMDAWSTTYLDGDGSVYVGSWYGQVYRLRDGTWTELSDRDHPPEGRVHAIARVDDSDGTGAGPLWIATGRGLWRLSDDGFVAEQALVGDAVVAVGRGPDDVLYAAGERALFRHARGGWSEVWRPSGDDRRINALHLRPSGELLVGTHDGFVVLDAEGDGEARVLEGSWISGFAEAPAEGGGEAELWVATWQEGLRVRHAGEWKKLGFAEGLGDDSLSDLAIDRAGRIWLTLYGEDVRVAPLERARGLVAALESPVLDPRVQLFSDACEAGAAVLGGAGRGSGQVAVASLPGDGETGVFFAGIQVCPDGVAHRRDDGEIVALSGGAVHRSSGGIVPLPPGVAEHAVTRLLLDGRDRLWVGTRGRGLHRLDPVGGPWRRPDAQGQLDHGTVSALAEDGAGRIWVGTLPPHDRATGQATGAGLHRFEDGRWTHVTPSDRGRSMHDHVYRGLPSATTNAVVPLASGDVAVGTNGGLSLWSGPGRIRTYTATDVGLRSSFVDAIAEDPDGDLWLGHAFWGHGLTVWNGLLFRGKSSRDGLFDDRIVALAHDGDGQVWLRSSSGRVALYTREVLAP